MMRCGLWRTQVKKSVGERDNGVLDRERCQAGPTCFAEADFERVPIGAVKKNRENAMYRIQ